MNQLSKFYCFIIPRGVNTQPPTPQTYDHLQPHICTHKSMDTCAHVHTGAALISDCPDDRCLSITRHQSILFEDKPKVVVYFFRDGMSLNYLKNQDKHKHPEEI